MMNFDELISNGELTKAARLFAKEYYDSGRMGNTRRLLIEMLADKCDKYDAEIARQSVTSDEVAEAIEYFEDTVQYISGEPQEKDHRLAITALQEYQPWVSVQDRLPEREEHYLCCEMNYQAIFVAYYGTSGWQRPLYRETAVTHWKPIPEPPKGE